MSSRRTMTDSAQDRPLALRRRPDLEIQPQQFAAETYWLVTDPLTLNYYHLCPEEEAILAMLDGRTSLGEIKRRFERAFAPLQITMEQLYAFVGRMHQAGLLLSDAAGQGERLQTRLVTRRRRAGWAALANVLAIRFPGLDPQPLLDWLYPKCRWIFSWWFVGLCLTMIVTALGLTAVKYHDICSRLPEFQAFLSPANVVWLAAALAVTKILHELGHALCCKHFGGECHELGVLLLVFTPCLYCDVSSAWGFSSKWQRIAVSAAGVFVEMSLAAVAAFLWWFSAPGFVNSLCLSMMFVCSINTLVFNGNPLLRYDGYYVLADLLEVPNLQQQSQGLVRRGLAWLMMGSRLPADREMPIRRRTLLGVYGVAAIGYRCLVLVGILWFCYRALKPYGLEPVAQALVLLVVGGVVAVPVQRLTAFLRDPSRRFVRWGRSLIAWACLGAAITAAVTIPMPCHVVAPAVLQPRDAHAVYVITGGRLIWAAASGAVVAKGEVVARLENPEVHQQIVELTGQRDQQRLHLENLKRQQASDTVIGSQIPAAESALADFEQRILERQRDQENLVLRAAVSGRVLPPPRLSRAQGDDRQLGTWQGSPLDRRNLGAYLDAGTEVCLVGQVAPLDAFVVVPQGDRAAIASEQRVRMEFEEWPGSVLHGAIAEVATSDLRIVPRELAKGAGVPVRIDSQGNPRPLVPSYQVRVVLDEGGEGLLLGARGWAKVSIEPQPLVRRAYRFLQRTFRLEL